jgi:L,D-transpeptidase YbiS
VTDSSEYRIDVHVAAQTLVLRRASGRVLMSTRISTARNGVGERKDSECTPRGRHIIRAKIGADQPVSAVFVSRRPTGEIYTPQLRAAYPSRDWILTRILWLSGLEPGRNRMGEVDTMRRYVYIHGCPDEDPMGVPGSRGCIKMRNEEIIGLFDLVPPGTAVGIEE